MDSKEKFINFLDWFLKEANIENHSLNVEKYTTMIYDNLEEKPDMDRKTFALCGKYHDIGKYMIDTVYPKMLEKAKFDVEDFQHIKEHPIMGEALLYLASEKTGYPTDGMLFNAIENACIYHHERIDGSGYYSISGDEIPFEAKAVAVADCFSAGIEKRIYKESKSEKDVIKEIYDSGQFDARVVKALEKGLEKAKGYLTVRDYINSVPNEDLSKTLNLVTNLCRVTDQRVEHALTVPFKKAEKTDMENLFYSITGYKPRTVETKWYDLRGDMETDTCLIVGEVDDDYLIFEDGYLKQIAKSDLEQQMEETEDDYEYEI